MGTDTKFGSWQIVEGNNIRGVSSDATRMKIRWKDWKKTGKDTVSMAPLLTLFSPSLLPLVLQLRISALIRVKRLTCDLIDAEIDAAFLTLISGIFTTAINDVSFSLAFSNSITNNSLSGQHCFILLSVLNYYWSISLIKLSV